MKNRIGEKNYNTHGELMEIVEYRSSIDITVKFESTNELVKCVYGSFKSGEVKSHLTPTVHGFGIIGFETIRDENNNMLESYNCWRGMIHRCYYKKYLDKKPTYEKCTVCEEWKYYSNFKKWFDDNYYVIGNEKMTLDKDILCKGNKEYSPNTCVFVPERINILFTKRQNDRGEYPIGVSEYKSTNRLRARCNNGYGKTINLGYFYDEIEAFNVYKDFKEKVIKQIADDYKDKIPDNLYEALYKYEVEITD